MIYHVFANRSNIGDWLSAKGIQKLLGDPEVTECLCDGPFLDETFQALSQATESDLVVVGGGGLFMDYFVPFWERFQAIAATVPFCIWGVGCCDIKHEQSLPPQDLIRRIADRSRLCIVRDWHTLKFVNSAKVPAPMPCPSVCNFEPIPAGPDVLHVANYSTVGADNYEVMRNLTRAFSEKRDVVFRETNNLINKGREDELAGLIKLYEMSGVVVSSALHGCILGAAMGRKVIAVSGDRKIEGFMEAVGLADWCIEADDGDSLNSLLENIDAQIVPHDALQHIKEQNLQVASNIMEILSSGRDTPVSSLGAGSPIR